MSKNKEDKFLNITGLMSGTSLDGIDISLIRTNGQDYTSLNKNFFYEYNSKTRKIFAECLENRKLILKKKALMSRLNKFVTKLHLKALNNSGFLKNTDIIGFHGQTIFHNAKNNQSIQLGNPKTLAETTRKKVIFNFRQNDIKNNGQGAPLAPIFHKAIIEKYKFNLPCCFLNIGGISNITYWDGNQLIGFDTGPGNALLDKYVQKYLKKNFDYNGDLASKGAIDFSLVNSFLANPYFGESFPKSLDKLHFNNEFMQLEIKKLRPTDSLATLVNFTVRSIRNSLNFLPQVPKNILVTGGGAKNQYLIKELKKILNINFIEISDYDINSDFIESELIAYLAARCVYNLPITYPSTTGSKKPLKGGEIYDL